MFVIMVLLLSISAVPITALQYGPRELDHDPFHITVSITGPDAWLSPFDERVTVNVTVEAMEPSVTQVNITEITVSITRSTGTDYAPIAADTVSPTIPASGATRISVVVHARLTGSISGPENYFAVSVHGRFANDTGTYSYTAISPDDFIGPFAITPGASATVTYVGIAVIAIFSLVVVLGAYGVKKSRAPPKKRHTLLDE